MEKFSRILALIVFFVLILCIPVRVSASTIYQEEPNSGESCYALDVVFIIDHSGSMSSIDLPTDPTTQRETAVEAMIDWIALNALDRCKNVRHQVGVIAFGDNAQIDVPMQEISPRDFQQYEALSDKMHELILAHDPPLGLTNPLSAFMLAKEMLEESKITGGGERKQVIVFLTDGIINLGDGRATGDTTQELKDWIDENFPFDPTLLKRENCIAELKETYKKEQDPIGKIENVPYEMLNDCRKKFDPAEEAYSQSTYLHMILMNYGEAWPKKVKALYSEITTSHAGSLMDFYDQGNSENRNEIPTYFQITLADLMEIPSGAVECGANVINPYLDTATLLFYKFSEDTQVKIRYVDHNNLTHEIVNGNSPTGGFNVKEYKSYGTNERYIFDDPYPGIWYFESDRCTTGGINIFYSEVALDTADYSSTLPPVQQYDLPPYYDESDPMPFKITYQMRDVAGNVVINPEDPFFAVNAVVNVKSPEGESITYPMNWVASDMRFETTDPIQVKTAGKYFYDLRGTVKIHEGERPEDTLEKAAVFNAEKLLFHHEDLEFLVNEVTPFVIKIESPAEEQVYPQIHETILKGWPLRIKPIDVKAKLQFRDEKDLDVPVTDILIDPGTALSAWIEYPDGTKTESITLNQDPGELSLFSGQFEGLESTEPLKLNVLLGENAATSDYRPDYRKLTVQFSRMDKSIFSKAGFYKLLLLIIILLAIAKIIYEVWLRLNKLRGSLVIRTNGSVIDDVPLFNGKRIKNFKKSEISHIHLRKLKVINLPQPKTKTKDHEEQEIIIMVIGKTNCESKESFNFRLSVNESNGYCNEHPEYDMFYKIESQEAQK